MASLSNKVSLNDQANCFDERTLRVQNCGVIDKQLAKSSLISEDHDYSGSRPSSSTAEQNTGAEERPSLTLVQSETPFVKNPGCIRLNSCPTAQSIEAGD